MALVTITRKPEALQSYQITSPEDMLAALKYLGARGYSGTITLTGSTWSLYFQDPSRGIGQSANVTDHIVIANGVFATAVAAADFTTLYQ